MIVWSDHGSEKNRRETSQWNALPVERSREKEEEEEKACLEELEKLLARAPPPTTEGADRQWQCLPQFKNFVPQNGDYPEVTGPPQPKRTQLRACAA